LFNFIIPQSILLRTANRELRHSLLVLLGVWVYDTSVLRVALIVKDLDLLGDIASLLVLGVALPE